MKICIIEGLDASAMPGPVSLKEGTEQKPLTMTSAGVLLEYNEDGIRFAQDIYMVDDNKTRVRDTAVIPKALLQKVKVIDVKGFKVYMEK